MEGTEFVFDYVHSLYYKCHKLNVIKNKKATMNPINRKDNKRFQYSARNNKN